MWEGEREGGGDERAGDEEKRRGGLRRTRGRERTPASFFFSVVNLPSSSSALAPHLVPNSELTLTNGAYFHISSNIPHLLSLHPSLSFPLSVLHSFSTSAQSASLSDTGQLCFRRQETGRSPLLQQTVPAGSAGVRLRSVRLAVSGRLNSVCCTEDPPAGRSPCSPACRSRLAE